MATLIVQNCAPIFFDQKYPLPIQMEFLWEINDNNYWLIYLHQIIFSNLSGYWASGFDGLVGGFIIRIYQQLDLLGMRIKEIPESIEKEMQENPKDSKLKIEIKILSKIIQQHQKIYELIYFHNYLYENIFFVFLNKHFFL